MVSLRVVSWFLMIFGGISSPPAWADGLEVFDIDACAQRMDRLNNAPLHLGVIEAGERELIQNTDAFPRVEHRDGRLELNYQTVVTVALQAKVLDTPEKVAATFESLFGGELGCGFKGTWSIRHHISRILPAQMPGALLDPETLRHVELELTMSLSDSDLDKAFPKFPNEGYEDEILGSPVGKKMVKQIDTGLKRILVYLARIDGVRLVRY